MLEEIKDYLRKGSPVVLEGPPGSGKTLLASKLFSSASRALYLARTIAELRTFTSYLPEGINYITAYGKPQVCHVLEEFSYRDCAIARLWRRCSTTPLKEDYAWLSTNRTPEEIREKGRETGRCMYYALRRLASKHRKVVATYDYAVFNQSILDNRDVIVYDEAHYILSIMESSVIEVDSGYISALVASLKKRHSTRGLAYLVKSLWRKTSSVTEFARRLEDALANYYGDVPRELEQVLSAVSRGKCYCRGKEAYILPVNPKLVVRSNGVYMGVIVPDFILPKGTVRLTLNARQPVRLIVDARASSRYKDRNDGVYREYARLINDYLVDDSINLVVFPSRDFMEKTLSVAPWANRITSSPETASPGEVIAEPAGGRFTEGVNIPGLRNVIIAGAPYPSPSPALSLLAKTYGWDRIVEFEMLLRTLQAIGRIRGEGRAVLIDERFTSISFDKWDWLVLERVKE